MIKPINLTFGSDPELFISKGGSIIGSERVIPFGGLKAGTSVAPNVIMDGVQIELNPPARSHPYLLGSEISLALDMVDRQIRKFPGVEICWDTLVEVSRAELDNLSDRSRILGCMPSFNVYGLKPLTVDPKVYRKRSAGGHMHFALPPILKRSVKDVVTPIDIMAGNLGVLFDRAPGAAERRENYGRAGEYRITDYGIEYRTLSNFWLRSYSLCSLMFGMASFAIAIVQETRYGSPVEDELIAHVNIKDITTAIDTNNFDLALANFRRLKPFLSKWLPNTGYPLSPSSLDKFEHLAEGVGTKGVETYFPLDNIDAWVRNRRIEFAEFVNRF
jgi:hypothetical protein